MLQYSTVEDTVTSEPPQIRAFSIINVPLETGHSLSYQTH